jgi:hypothetical protein
MPDLGILPGVVSCSASLCVCEKGLLWIQALWLLRSMLEKKLDLRIDIHRLVGATTLLHQVDLWDGVVDYSIHQFAYDLVLSCFGQICIPFQTLGASLIRLSSCERGHR